MGLDSAIVRAVNEGGQLYTLGDNLLVENADAVTLYLNAETSFRHHDPELVCRDKINQAVDKGFDGVLADHIADYQALFGRVELCLGGTENDFLPLMNVCKGYEGHEDHSLVSLYLSMGVTY